MAELNLQVSNNNDDFRRVNGVLYVSPPVLRAGGFTNAPPAEQEGSGMRFQNVTVPQGSTIEEAYLTFTASFNFPDVTVNTRISAQDVDNPSDFSGDTWQSNYDRWLYQRTSARVDWDSLPAWTIDTEYQSPDIKTVIQEIVNRAGWASGNAIVLFWNDWDARSTQNTKRQAYPHNVSSAKAVKLYIRYTPPIVLPSVTTNPATSVAANSTVLNGKLDSDGGEACDCGFEWGETIGYGNTTPTQSRTTGQTFAQTISGLDPKKTYHFRALATNSAGTGHGDDRTFTTLAVAPTVATNPAIDINNISATLKGELTYDGGEACNCGFEYGETETYGTTTPTQSKVTGEAFSQPITGLDPDKTYHIRAIATNSAGTSHGADKTFKTLVSAPAVTTNPATGLGAVLATLNGTLDDDIGEACECDFEWGLDTDYGITTPTETKAAVNTFSQTIHGLFPNTTYHFRALGTNSFGTGYGADRTFTTAPVVSRAFALAREEL